jgi:tetratricopeptide (TPR) repeat protein
MRWRSLSLIALTALALGGNPLSAQDADTAILRNDSRKFTILSQIQDPREAAAFLKVLDATEAAVRYKLANEFLSTYPQSWLLAQAYDAAARSAIDLAKYDEALAAGRFSLRLLPENPSLLILLANVEAQRNLFEQAMQDANDALEYVNEIERPPNMNQAEWKALKPQLKSSAYFAKGRAEASRGPETLPNALADLNRAAAWNSDDAEVFYLRAIVELRLRDNKAAAADLAFVLASNHPLGEKAKKILLLISRQMAAGGVSLDAFVKGLPARAIDKSLRAEPQPPAYPQALAYGYAGPEACRNCHSTEYAAWRTTGMAKMFRPYQPANVLGDFSPGTQYREDADSGAIRIGMDKRPYFEFPTHGNWQRFYVDFTIGSKWQQGYATKLPDGRFQVFPIEYNLLQKKWINYWKAIDPPGSPRAVIQDFPKFTPATNYQRNCAVCHTSQLKLDASADSGSMEHAVYLQP